MSEIFNIEIISPSQTLLKSEVNQVAIPAFEGSMTILKDHIPIVTFLRPGLIEIESKQKNEKFFVEEGTVEFSKNNLLILSSTAVNLKEISEEYKENIIKSSKEEFNKSDKTDKEKYVLSYKIETLNTIK